MTTPPPAGAPLGAEQVIVDDIPRMSAYPITKLITPERSLDPSGTEDPVASPGALANYLSAILKTGLFSWNAGGLSL